MDLGIKGKKAIVAGGSAGMGKGAAYALAREGVDILLSARGEARLRATAAEISEATGAKVTPVAGDHGTKEGRAALLAACPNPDILVITLSPPGVTEDFREIEESDWIASFASSMIGPVELMKSVVDGMCERKFGRIVNIATIAAKFPIELRLLSGPARSALLNYTGAVSRKVARHNVVINNLLPGMYLTENLQAQFLKTAELRGEPVELVVERFVKRWRIPTQTCGNPNDIGAFAAMFCSQFANFTIGQNLAFDGGMGNAIF